MDLGVFLPVANNGYIVSTNAPMYKPTWELNSQVALAAERAGFEFLFSMAKWRGFGGVTEHWDYSMESFSLVGALAAITNRIKIYGSAATLTMHPAVVAKMSATLSDVSAGRFGLNIVAGWNRHEYSQMGLWPGDEFYGQRYDMAAEFVEVIQRLWTGEHVDFAGQWFNVNDCISWPAPRQAPTIVCAGQSEQGMRFTASVGDYNFVNAADVATAKQLVQHTRIFGEKAGRSVGTYVLFTIIAAETDAEAVSYARHIVEGGDVEALSQMIIAAGNDPSAQGAAGKLREQAFMGFPTIIGSYERVAETLDALEIDAGAAGAMLTWPDFLEGIAAFSERIQPLMSTRGGAG